MVADIPFSVWAERKISVTTSRLLGSFSSWSRNLFRASRCSCASVMNRSLYWEISISIGSPSGLELRHYGFGYLVEREHLAHQLAFDRCLRHAEHQAGLLVLGDRLAPRAVSYTHLRAHETDSYLVCRLLL